MLKANLSHPSTEQPETLRKQRIVKVVVDLESDGGEGHQVLERPKVPFLHP